MEKQVYDQQLRVQYFNKVGVVNIKIYHLKAQ